MRSNSKVIWHEGLFLEPQHMQQHDRHIDFNIRKRWQFANNNFWGVETIEFDQDLLSLGKVGLSACSGVFPDGTLFDMPSVDNLPAVFEVPKNVNQTTLYLALPLRQAGIAEVGTVDQPGAIRYQASNLEVRDVVADSDYVTQIQTGSLACKILSDIDGLEGHTYLPIAKIEDVSSNGRITLDKRFIASCITLDVSSLLKNFVVTVHGQLNHRGQMLAERLTDTQAAGTAEVVDFVLLQMINRYEPVFHYMLKKSPIHPEDLYVWLLQLLGEMSTFTNDKRRPIEAPAYRHEDLFNTFQPVIVALTEALSMVLEQNATAIPLKASKLGAWTGRIEDKKILSTCRFVLAAYSDLPSDQLRSELPKQIKISPLEQISTLVRKSLPGVDISPMPAVPRQIPYHNNFTYFEVNTKHELWASLEKSAGIGIHISSPYPGLKLELWAIRG